MSRFRMIQLGGITFGEGETVAECRADAVDFLNTNHSTRDAKAWTDSVLVCEAVDEALEQGKGRALIIVSDEVYRALPEATQ